MRKNLIVLLPIGILSCAIGFMAVPPTHVRAQGKNASDWPTANATPQRDAWVRQDAQISKQNMQSMKGFGVVRKVQLSGPTGEQPMPAFNLLSSARGGYGFKSIGYTTDASGNAVGIDSDNGIVYWKTKVGEPATATCAGVL